MHRLEIRTRPSPSGKKAFFGSLTFCLKLSPSRFELFATHHYFTGEFVRFRLSSTII